MPMFEVPEDELRTERINLPDGRYQGDFAGTEFVGNDDGWRALGVRFTNLATGAGDAQITTQFKGREVTIDLASREMRTRYTVEAKNEQAVQIGARDLVRLAIALGVAERNNGSVAAPGETIEELAEAFNARAGTRVNFSVKNRPRKRAKVVQTNDKGEPIIDDEIARVWAIEGD